MTPAILDLFAGAGGMALGFQAAGGRCIGAVEQDPAAARTFARSFAAEEPVIFGGPERGAVENLPVSELLAALPAAPDVVIGGPPCQGFSRVGKAKQRDLLPVELRALQGDKTDPDRNQLYKYFIEVLLAARPLAFVMENVPDIREQRGGDFAKRISREAHYAGYNVRYFLLNAAHYGVPQHRWRIFFVGFRSDLGHRAIPRPPPRTHRAPVLLEGIALPDDRWMIAGESIPEVTNPKPAITVRQAIGDLPKLKGHLREEDLEDQRLPLRRPPSPYVQTIRSWPGLQAAETVSGNWYRNNQRDFPIFRLMASQDRFPEARAIGFQRFQEHLSTMSPPPRVGTAAWKVLKDEFVPPYRNDAFHDKWRKLDADQPSWTVTAHLQKDTYSHIHYDNRQARTITIREAARLQSFPDAIDFAGNYGEQFRQIGNAVPPLLAKAIAEELFQQLEELCPQSLSMAATG